MPVLKSGELSSSTLLTSLSNQFYAKLKSPFICFFIVILLFASFSSYAAMKVHRFEWSPSVVTLGTPTTFYWNIEGAEFCFGNNKRRTAVGNNGRQLFSSPVNRTTSWYCQDSSGDRIYLTANVRVLPPAPGRLSAPSAPSNVPINSNQTISWSSTSGADYFNLYQNGNLYYQGNRTSTTISSSTSGTNSYRVNACNDGGCGPLSSTRYVSFYDKPSTPSSIPDVVGGSYHPYGTTVQLSLPTVANATYYQVFMSTTDSNYQLQSSATQVTLRDNWGYNYIRYKACNSAGCSGLSSWRRTHSYGSPKQAYPTASSNLVTTGNTVKISWPNPRQIIYSGTHYERQIVSPSNKVTNLSRLNHVSGASATEYTSPALTENGVYTFKVRACNPSLPCGPWGSTTVNVPVNITQSPTLNVGYAYHPVNSSKEINWSAVTGTNRYELYEGETRIHNHNSIKDFVTHSNYGRRHYKVRACNEAGCGPFSSSLPIYFYTAPGGVNNFKATPASLEVGGTTRLSWDLPGGDVPGISYVIARDGAEIGRTTNRFIDVAVPNLQNNFTIVACNPENVGCGSTRSVSVEGTPITPPTAIPSVLGGHYYPLNSTINVNISAISGATSYRLKVETGTLEGANKQEVLNKTFTGSTTSFSSAKTGYHFVSYAQCKGSYCSEFGPTQRIVVYGKPGFAKNVVADPVSVNVGSSANIKWSFNGVRVGGHYKVQQIRPNGTTKHYANVSQTTGVFDFSQVTESLVLPGVHTFNVNSCNDDSLCSGNVTAAVNVYPTTPDTIPNVDGGHYKAVNNNVNVTLPTIAGAKSYNLKLQTGNLAGTNKQPAPETITYQGNVASFTPKSTGYYFLSYAQCSDGLCSDYSPEVRIHVYGKSDEVTELSALPASVFEGHSSSISWKWARKIRVGAFYRVKQLKPDSTTVVHHDVVQEAYVENHSMTIEQLVQVGAHTFTVSSCNDETLCTDGVSVVINVKPQTPSQTPEPVGGNYQRVNSNVSVTMPIISGAQSYKLKLQTGNLEGTNKQPVTESITYQGNIAKFTPQSTGYYFLSYAHCSNGGCSKYGPEVRIHVYGKSGEATAVSVDKTIVNAGNNVTVSWKWASGIRVDGYYEVAHTLPNGTLNTAYKPKVVQKAFVENHQIASPILNQKGKHKFKVLSCNDETLCTTGVVTEVDVIDPITVNRFEWAPNKVVVGQPSTFYWSISGVETCQRADVEVDPKGPRANVGNNGVQIFKVVQQKQTKWECFTKSGVRYPFNSSEFITAQLDVLEQADGVHMPVLRKNSDSLIWTYNSPADSYKLEVAKCGASCEEIPYTAWQLEGYVTEQSYLLPELVENKVYRIQACNAQQECGAHSNSIAVTVDDTVNVNRFEWVKQTTLIGQPKTFYWDITGVRDCRAIKNGETEVDRWRGNAGNNGIQTFMAEGDYTTTWECFVGEGETQRYPSDPSKFITATHRVLKDPDGINIPELKKEADTLNWSTIANAQSYELQHYACGESCGNYTEANWQLAQENASTSFILPNDDTKRAYRVKACFADESCTAWSNVWNPELHKLYSRKLEELTANLAAIEDASFSSPILPPSEVVGTLNSKAEVNGGGVSYTVPIKIPPGRKGISPEVALSYRSNRVSQSSVGLSWTISGISSINRCDANYIEDGFYNKYDLSDDDKLCLNGQKLVVVEGEYGVAGSKYRTLSESYNLVELLGDDINGTGAYFKVTNKAGNVIYYGQTLNSRLQDSESTVTLSWYINKLVDDENIGNNIEYVYDNENGEINVSNIYYTGFGTTRGTRQVEFAYVQASNSSFSYVKGKKFNQSKQLSSIHAYVGDSLVREYNLNYKDSGSEATGRRLLESIQECGINPNDSSEECLPKRMFDYTGKAITFEKVVSTNTLFNSDMPWSQQNQIIADFNNDGTLDIVKNKQLHLLSLENNQVVIDKVIELPFKPVPKADAREYLTLGSLDIDHNGVLDLIGVGENGLRIAQLNDDRTEFQSTDLNIQMQCSVKALTINTFTGKRFYGFDYKHREACRADAFSNNEGGYYLFHRSSYSELMLSVLDESCENYVCSTKALPGIKIDPNSTFDTFEYRPTDYQVTDFNSDGVPDVVRLEHDGDDVFVKVFQINERRNLETNERNLTLNVYQLPVNVSKYWSMAAGGHHWIDANGDGNSDLLVFSHTWKLYINNGGNFELPIDTGIEVFDFDKTYEGWNWSPRASYTTNSSVKVLDFNGDGNQDFMFLHRNLDKRDCMSDRSRSMCKEGNGSESAGPDDFNISNMAFGDYSVYLSNIDATGNVNFELLETDITGTLGFFYASDFNSDGVVDFYTAKYLHDGTIAREWQDNRPTEYYIYFGQKAAGGETPDLLKKAYDQKQDGDGEAIANMGIDDRFFYKSFLKHWLTTNEAASFTNEGLADYSFRVPSSDPVVVLHRSQNNHRYSDIYKRYQYSPPVYNRAGLGFVGFERITESNSATYLSTEFNFNTHYPLVGRLAELKTRKTSDDTLINEKSITWCSLSDNECTSIDDNTYFIYKKADSAIYNDVDGTLLYSVSNNYNSYDIYGNLKLHTETISDAVSTKTKTNKFEYYAADENSWWLNKLNYSETKTQKLYSEQYSLDSKGFNNTKWFKKTYAWDTEINRRVSSITETASGTGISKVTSFTSYDKYGNVQQQQIEAVADENAEYSGGNHTQVTTFDRTSSSGYFTNKIKNNIWDEAAVTKTFDVGSGLVTSETSIEGMVINYKYDAFGKLIEQDSNTSKPRYFVYQWCNETITCNHDASYQVTEMQEAAATKVTEYNKAHQPLVITTNSLSNADKYIIESFKYDNLGRVTNHYLPAFEEDKHQNKIAYSGYDVLSRPSKKIVTKTPQNYDVTYSYVGLKTTFTVNAGADGVLTMEQTHDSQGLLMGTKDALNGVSSFSYDANDNVILLKDASNNYTYSNYDGFGFKKQLVDPNMGTWHYRYNAFGQKRWEKNAKNIELRYDYDAIGRLTHRYVNNALDSQWRYDASKDNTLSSTSRKNHKVEYVYDNKGRATKETTSIKHDGQTREFIFEYAYDANYGWLKGTKYPSGEVISHRYDSYGNLIGDVDENTSETLRSITQLNAAGSIAQANYLNDLKEHRSFYAGGEVSQVCVTKLDNCTSSSALSNIAYVSYDNFGNLKKQQDNITEVHEDYVYDDLHRLDSATRSAHGFIMPEFTPITVDYDYDAVGNITSKSDYATNYNYLETDSTTGGPNAVKSLKKLNGETIDFAYDNNGNLTQGDNFSAMYNIFDKPVTLARGTSNSAFEYDADGTRYIQIKTVDGQSSVTFYVGAYEEVHTSDSDNPLKKHHISSFGLITHEEGFKQLLYLHGDRLGSINLLTYGYVDDNRALEYALAERRSFDMFGKPRDEFWGDSKQGFLKSDLSTRGFTAHEHLDELAVIHMNGRVFDFNLGRFLSVDPVIQAPENTQSINPYSYLMNNPLAGTDPSGYTGLTMMQRLGGWQTVYQSPTETQKEQITDKGEIEAGEIGGTNSALLENLVQSLATIDDVRIGKQMSQLTVDLVNNKISSEEYIKQMGAYGDGAIIGISIISPIDEAALAVYAISKTGQFGLRVGSVTKNGDGVFQFGDELVKQIAQQQYKAGFSHLKQYMSPKEIKAYLADPDNGSRFIGHAVHRGTEATLQKMHPGRFDYNATRAFDFLDKATGQAIELTTKKGVKTHLNRAADIVTYN
ncbi:RHS repeat-associated core domain-containing protein [Pseudoalteromonas sp. P1-9]|uniref:RHS repeat-associated core domain-containing protein n=1 Tax=Pseudoalteromonas sp. P1-9 TaxID=1710354 RepID=UPI001F31E7E3|nr:RHS repeat-associated core domain-containing protein [Pseudoalteromonas sp. P1-9]